MFGTCHWPVTSHHSDVLPCVSHQWDLAIFWPVLQILQKIWMWHYVVDVMMCLFYLFWKVVSSNYLLDKHCQPWSDVTYYFIIFIMLHTQQNHIHAIICFLACHIPSWWYKKTVFCQSSIGYIGWKIDIID